MRARAWCLLIASGALLAVAAPAAAQGAPPTHPDPTPSIRVTAWGEARAEPDQAFADFGVETAAPTARAAGEENAARMQRVIDALVRAGVPRGNIETRDYNVYPDYAPPLPGQEAGEPRIRGYRVSNTVSVRTDDIGRVGALIDAALAAGANRVNSVTFGLRNPEAARAEALQQAVRKARAEAEAIATGLGVRLGRILDVSTVESPRFGPVMETMAMDAVAQRAPTPIQPREQRVAAGVVVVYAFTN